MSTENLSEKHLHLIAFDIPVPVNYGGAIDIFHKLEPLASAGIKVHLHCYQYGRGPAIELKDYCDSVHYYPRQFSVIHFFNQLPFIVISRKSPALLEEILGEPYPVLFEGLHSCYFLDHPGLQGRRKIVRTHNIEHEYYTSLGQVEKNPWKRLYFFREAAKLKKFEQILKQADGIAAISPKDHQHFHQQFPQKNIETISAFHPFNQVEMQKGKGNFALYHGSLEVGENNEAAVFLIREVFHDLDIPLVIAGNKPSRELEELAGRNAQVELKRDVTTEEIYQLIRDAQVNILPTFQATGIKLKLLGALYLGRHCIVNRPMVEHTGLESLCQVCDSALEMKTALKQVLDKSVTGEDIAYRTRILTEGQFTNKYNINKLIRLLFPD